MRYSFLPTLPFSFSDFAIQQITTRGTSLTITACATSPRAVCPSCQHVSFRVHSYYARHSQDVPSSGSVVPLVLQVRRFRCMHAHCPRQTFAERLSDLPASARQTTRLAKL